MPFVPPVAGPFAAIIVSKKRKRIIAAFRDAEATSPDRAKTLDDLGLSKSGLLEIQRLRGVIVEVGEGRYYVDEAREAEVARFRRFLVLGVVMVAAGIALVMYLAS